MIRGCRIPAFKLILSGIVTLASLMIFSGCALFNDAPRSTAKDGQPGRLPIEPEGFYGQVGCTGYRDASQSRFYYQYEFTSAVAARSQLCPLNRNSSGGGGWRTSEDISIDANTDTVRLTAELEASSYEIAGTWPVPPSLVVYCWDLTDAAPGALGIGLYFYGLPHDFTSSFLVSHRFNDNRGEKVNWRASSLEAEAIFIPEWEIAGFISNLRDATDDTGYELEMTVYEGAPDHGRISFDVSGWDRAVAPLVEECGVSL